MLIEEDFLGDHDNSRTLECTDYIYIYDACNSFCDCDHMYNRCTHRKSRAQGNVNMLLVMPKVNTCVLKSAAVERDGELTLKFNSQSISVTHRRWK